MSNTTISLVSLDFPTIKENLKDYLKRSDSPFKDVDFEASNISQLLDVLSYNTYLNSFYLNMVASEMFLDTAQLRDSVVSHAKELNYVPRSFRSAEAQISFTITPTSPLNAIIIPKGTSFTTKVGSNNYSFTTQENQTVSSNTDGKFYVATTVYEGSYLSDTFVFNSANTNQRFVLSNPTIDTRSLTVIVIENNGANTYTYTRASSFLGNSANSQIYFLQAAENNQYELIFGDNVIGRTPKSGAVILAEYRVCNGELPNGARLFDIDGPVQGQANISTISTVSSAVGGAVSETLSSIKYNSVRYYQNQERAVTTSDYESLLSINFPEINAVSAYGGESLDPPQYGKVFVAVDIEGSDGTPDTIKKKYFDFLKSRSPLSIDPVIVDPEFIYIEAQATVSYNVNATTLVPTDIETLVKATISQYNTNNLNGFKKTLYYSKLIEDINNAHPSITNVDLNVVPFVKVVPTIGQPFSVDFDLGFELSRYYDISRDDFIRAEVPALYSTSFTFQNKTCNLKDDGLGNIGVYFSEGYNQSVLLQNVGTVNYTTGRIIVSNLIVEDYVRASGVHMHIYVNPLTKAISSDKNYIISLDDGDIEIDVVPTKL